VLESFNFVRSSFEFAFTLIELDRVQAS